MDRRWIPVLLVVGLPLLVWNLACFTVPVWRQAIVVQLGDPVRIAREAGLYLKIPFIQQVLWFDRRLLDYDAAPKEILTRDKQQLVVDNYSRWRIVDPLQFYRTVRSEQGAQSRLDDIVYSNVRETLGRHTLQEIVSEKRDEEDEPAHFAAAGGASGGATRSRKRKKSPLGDSTSVVSGPSVRRYASSVRTKA